MTTQEYRPRHRPPWRMWSVDAMWGATAHLGLDLVVGIVGLALVIPTIVSAALVPVFLAGVPFLALSLWAAGLLARVERRRFAATVGLALADPPSPPVGSRWSRTRRLLTGGDNWRAVLYLFVMIALGTVNTTLLVAFWSGSVALVLLPLYYGRLAGGSANLGLFTVHSVLPALLVAAVTLALAVAVLPLLTRLLITIDVAVAVALLGPPPSARLTERVIELTETRTRAVDSAEQERRRMERDLHDGAQQQLVAMSMTVGRLSSRLRKSGDSDALALADQAQLEVRQAITELRDLTRGLHPPVLTDRGLDAALSAVAARSPVPVTVSVDLPERPSLTLESIAYFFVSEALTNVAKHARASRAAVGIRRQGAVILVTVSDDGVGGIDPSHGTGIAGLADRAAGVDGTLTVTSPPGGPTTLEMELPCGS